MYKVTIGDDDYQVFFERVNCPDGKETASGRVTSFLLRGSVNDKPVKWDIAEYRNGCYHIIDGTKSFLADILEVDKGQKKAVIRIGGRKYTVEKQDRYDMLIQQLGLTGKGRTIAKELKSPMPGLIIDVFAEEGKTVKKGERILVLEAMKMENVIKSPVDGVIKSVHVSKGNKVEKSQVLVRLE